MKNKAIFVICVIIIAGIFIYILCKNNKNENKDISNIIDTNQIDELESSLDNETIEVTSTKEKTTPNTIFVFKKEYLDCNHILTNEVEIPNEMVNLSEEEIQEKYPNWEIQEFSEDQVVFYMQLESFCGEHYFIIQENGYISVYIVDEEGNKSLEEETDIAVSYLPETDKISLEKGFMVYGKEELNKLLEDFE